MGLNHTRSNRPRPDGTVRVATYTRISTDEEHQPYWQLTRQYSDQLTGSVLERPDLQRALSDARMRRFDLLLVYRVDRLSRSVRGWLISSKTSITRPWSSEARPSLSTPAPPLAG